MARIDITKSETAGKFMKRFVTASRALEDGSLPKNTQELVKIRASQINGCGVCLDMHVKDAAAAGETPVRLALIAAWRDTNVFTDAERAALALTEEGTRIADQGHPISDATWAEVTKHYDDDQAAILIGLIAVINTYNRINVLTGQLGGDYVPGAW
ncbi:carboxymuconolactone decarboxylase family protein [Nocardia sp. NPDC020380]|uniref:carboxymuconolactone decarboxylase family protein n=1 Tax=Nocardia sp. NPDC020380 TaxID=3364309 RepID=UPI0037932DDE